MNHGNLSISPILFNIDAYQQRNYYQGKGFYRRTLVLPEIVAERRYYMKIDAASKAANIRVNGKEVGSHVGGYTACIVDITEYIRKENLIEITVDNGRKDITPISADFTFLGGGSTEMYGSYLLQNNTSI